MNSGCVNNLHQIPTYTDLLVSWINENTSDYVAVEPSSADNFFAQQCYENPALSKLCDDDFRSKAPFNLSNHIRRVIL